MNGSRPPQGPSDMLRSLDQLYGQVVVRLNAPDVPTEEIPLLVARANLLVSQMNSCKLDMILIGMGATASGPRAPRVIMPGGRG